MSLLLATQHSFLKSITVDPFEVTTIDCGDRVEVSSSFPCPFFAHDLCMFMCVCVLISEPISWSAFILSVLLLPDKHPRTSTSHTHTHTLGIMTLVKGCGACCVYVKAIEIQIT